MKKKHFIKTLILMIILFFPLVHYGQEYHEADKEGLRVFLRQKYSDGVYNFSRLGLAQWDTLTWENDEYWTPKVKGLTWNNETPKRISKIDWNENRITGDLNADKWNAIDTIIIKKGRISSINVTENPNLSYFIITNNSIAKLDVSNNHLLKVLNCSGNKLSEIDVSQNLQLEQYYCGNNDLSEIDVSFLLELTSLGITNANISTLNLDNNAKLRTLSCNENALTALDLTHNKELYFLNCASNEIEMLNIEHCEKLKDLWCESNKLRSLNICNNPLLSTLLCPYNQLTELDVSHNPYLYYIHCYYNNLTELIVEQKSYLFSIICHHNQITYLRVKDVAPFMGIECNHNQISQLELINTSMHTLKCSNNQLTELTLDSKVTSLVYCSNNKISKLNIEHSFFNTLDCSGNLLTDLDISKNPNIQFLYCQNNKLKFTTLPLKTNLMSEYKYSPQAKIEGGVIAIDDPIDLSDEYFINGLYTAYSWSEIISTGTKPITVEGDEGVFRVNESFYGKKLRCSMKNDSFKDLRLMYEVSVEDDPNLISDIETLTKLFPNPSQGKVTLKADSELQRISFFSLEGKFLFNQTLSGKETTVDISSLKKGAYLALIQLENGKTTGQKVMVQ